VLYSQESAVSSFSDHNSITSNTCRPLGDVLNTVLPLLPYYLAEFKIGVSVQLHTFHLHCTYINLIYMMVYNKQHPLLKYYDSLGLSLQITSPNTLTGHTPIQIVRLCKIKHACIVCFV
jgi:hypothetical protein